MRLGKSLTDEKCMILYRSYMGNVSSFVIDETEIVINAVDLYLGTSVNEEGTI